MQHPTTQSSELTATAIINEWQLGDNICSAVKQNRRADFALLVAMFSDDACEIASVETIENKSMEATSASMKEKALKAEFHVPNAPALRSTQDSYEKGALISKHFHNGGIQSARLQSALNPEPLAYMTENTANLPEEVYKNLPFHSKRRTIEQTSAAPLSTHLYQNLIVNSRESQISAHR